MTKELSTETKKSPIAIGSFQGSRSLLLNSLSEIHQFASMVTKTDLVPKGYRGKPEDATVAIIYGMEIGLPPLASLQNISVVNGSPAVWGDAQLSLAQSSGKYEYHKSFFEGEFGADNFKAIFEVKRVGAKEPVIKEFSIADAKKAKLWGKTGTWETHPKVMLSYKARAFALREAFADVLKGMHSAEEMEGEQIIDVTPKPKQGLNVRDLKNSSTATDTTEKSDSSSVNTPFSNQEEQIELFEGDEIVTNNDEVVEGAFKRVFDGIKSMANAKGLNTFFDYSSKDDIEYLKINKPDYYAELMSLKAKRLGELSK